jgi:hypothetical protein
LAGNGSVNRCISAICFSHRSIAGDSQCAAHVALRYRHGDMIIERQHLIAALILLVTALFVGSGLPSTALWRRRLRRTAIAGILLSLFMI